MAVSKVCYGTRSSQLGGVPVGGVDSMRRVSVRVCVCLCVCLCVCVSGVVEERGIETLLAGKPC